MRRIFSLVLLFAVTGCSGLLADMAGAPPSLYELQAPTEFQSGLSATSRQVLVDVPISSAGIDTPRIALVRADGVMAYYKDASWTDRVPVMMQTMIVTAFDNSGLLPAVGRENVGLRADYLFKTDLLAFEADYRKGAVPEVVVAINAKLITMPRRMILTGQSFTARVQAESDSISSVRDAFQQASDMVLKDMVKWTVQTLVDQGRRR